MEFENPMAAVVREHPDWPVDRATLSAAADRIADVANECCTRGDGYREEVRDIALRLLTAAARRNLAMALAETRKPRH